MQGWDFSNLDCYVQYSTIQGPLRKGEGAFLFESKQITPLEAARARFYMLLDSIPDDRWLQKIPGSV